MDKKRNKIKPIQKSSNIAKSTTISNETSISTKQSIQNASAIHASLKKIPPQVVKSNQPSIKKESTQFIINAEFSDSKFQKNIKTKSQRQILTPARFKELQNKAEKAIKERKTFLTRGGQDVIRSTLINRGWVELLPDHLKHFPSNKCSITYKGILKFLPIQKKEESRLHYTNQCEKYILSRLIEHRPVALLWTNRRNKMDYLYKRKNPTVVLNKLLAIPFSTKGGLLYQLENLKWVSEAGVSEVNFPRSYNSTTSDDIAQFLEDYRNTACTSFLKYAVEEGSKSGWAAIFDKQPEAQIPFSAFEFALKRCYELINSYNHNDIDLKQPSLISEQDWDNFFTNLKLLTCEHARIRIDCDKSIDHLLKNAEMLLENLKLYSPHYDLDGYLNIWIVKPSCENCGRGLQITNSLKKIRSLANLSIKRYVLQKYIERPLLIYNTKFDIRQWFLITSVQPLVIWMYRENYLRFSTQVFNLLNWDESVHLTNNCIQRKYKVAAQRDERLPRQNMWDSNTFQAYLRQIGKGDQYHTRIYLGMKKAIIGTLLASQCNMTQPLNSFELFGADFMISEDLTPWLIEMNSCPDLSRSSNVTARLVPHLIDDTFKIIFDRKLDPNCSVGNFELIYNQVLPNTLPPSKIDLVAKETQLPLIYNIRREMYNHLVQKSGNRSQTRSHSNSLPSVPAKRAQSFANELTNKACSKSSTYTRLEGITKTLKRLSKGS